MSSAATPSTAASAVRGSAPCRTSALDHLLCRLSLYSTKTPQSLIIDIRGLRGFLPSQPSAALAVAHSSGNSSVSSLAAKGSASQPYFSQVSSACASRLSPARFRQVVRPSIGMPNGMLQRIQTVFFRSLWIRRSRSMA
jgi:hypothetical protein